MKLERSIQTSESKEIIYARIASYLDKTGYKQIDPQNPQLFMRGSVLGSILSFSPKGWQVKTTFEILVQSEQISSVSVNVDINTKGQVITERERLFWDNEIDGLEAAILTGRVEPVPANNAAKKSLKQNLTASALIIGLPILFFAVTLFLSDSTESACTGATFGVVLGVVVARIWLKV